jgi:hypothetical protein
LPWGNVGQKAYLVYMRSDKIIHFVSFETSLDREHFINKWENFVRSVNSDTDVTLQESKKNNLFRYIAQHRCDSDEFRFIFTKAAKITRSKEVEIKVKQIGGYSIVQEEKSGDAAMNESKLFAFLISPGIDLNPYKELEIQNKLNIYEAYYENCEYAYILEFFVKNKYVAEFAELLKQYNPSEVGIYKECLLHVE